MIPWPKYQPDAPSNRGWQPSLERAATPLLKKSDLVLHVGAIRGETTRDMLSSFDGTILATDPLWPDGFHSVRHFFATCWKYKDRAKAWAGDPIDFLEWVEFGGYNPDLIVINGDIGEKHPLLIPRITSLFGKKPMCGTEVAKMHPFLAAAYAEFERFDGFSWRVNAKLSGEKWMCPSDGKGKDRDWNLVTAGEAVELLEKGNVVLFCKSFGWTSKHELDKWYGEFVGSGCDVSISRNTHSFMAKGRRMSKVVMGGWVENIMEKCYEADVLVDLKV